MLGIGQKIIQMKNKISTIKICWSLTEVVSKTGFLVAILLLIDTGLASQTIIEGMITSTKGELMPGANVFLSGSYDGTVAESDGSYSFTTSLSGEQVLVATFIGYIKSSKDVNLTGGVVTADIELEENSGNIDGVVISAGTFETGDRKRSVTLQPLDIVTTPSALGEVYGALTSLPGTALIGEDGRLFVRGGDAYESKTFVNGLLAKKPYSSNVPDLPSRGRFSPFLFSGTTFSTGGYSAEYGQALSSALILTTNAFPQKTQTELSLMSIGINATQTLRWEDTSVTAGIDYMNMEPYYSLVSNRFEMNRHPRSTGGNFSLRQRIGVNGILKVLATYSGSEIGLSYPDLAGPGETVDISIDNKNLYANIYYGGQIGENWFIKGGLAYTIDENNLDLQSSLVDDYLKNLQMKVTVKKIFNENMSLIIGLEETFNNFIQDYLAGSSFKTSAEFDDFGSAVFSEIEIRPYHWLALRTGLRGEYSSLLKENNLAARVSAALKITEEAQISFAYGNFYQTPEEYLLRFTHSLNYERSDHYIANYQWEKNDRLFRVEAYTKDYLNLVTYDAVELWNGNMYDNNGNGNSKGIDVFFRDKETFSNVDYWISYSYINARRLYRDYPVKARPPFAPAHSASFVGKKWVEGISSQLGLSVTFATGRTYNDLNSSRFMDGKTPFYNNVSINCSHLRTIFNMSAIIYVSVNNLLGRENIFGYRYHETRGSEGRFESFPVRPDARRFYFAGLFLTIGN